MSNDESVICPFCKGIGFDLIGLKGHIQLRRCDVFESTPLPINPARRKAISNEGLASLPTELLAQLTLATRGQRRGNQNTKKTHCLHGHPLSGNNIKMEGQRRKCRICLRSKKARLKKAKRVMPRACYDCQLPYNNPGFADLIVPNDVWAKIAPTEHGGGLLCPTCLTRRVKVAGLDSVPATFRSGPFACVSVLYSIDTNEAGGKP